MLRWAIAMLCLTVAVLGAGMQFHPYGPHGPLMRTIQVVVLISALVVGVLWVSLPWPSYRMALAFAVWADVAVTVGAAVLSSPEARLLATIHMGMVGLFVGFLLGWRVLLVHCGFCVLVITALTVWGIHDGMSASLLYVIVAPALSTVVGIPMMVQAVVEGGRIGLRRITGQSLLDPLTKLLNRRGLDEYTKSLTARVDPPHWLVVIVVDLDGFKRFNDDNGHARGDALLRRAARILSDGVTDGRVARVGGDEFIAVAAASSTSDIDAMAASCLFTLDGPHDHSVTASVGVAAAHWNSQPLADLYDAADAAMYRAKRAGRSRVETTIL